VFRLTPSARARWAETRLNEADTTTLNHWAINVLQADTLEAVFSQ
jgi:hypothetical protein